MSDFETEPSDWISGVVAGVIGGIVFGVMSSMMMPQVIRQAIPALFGVSGQVAGWIIHLGFSGLFGVGFGALGGTLGWGDSLAKSVGGGIGYGAVLWLVNIVFIWPAWLRAVGFPKAPALPNVAAMPLAGHLVFGFVLGIVYPYVSDF